MKRIFLLPVLLLSLCNSVNALDFSGNRYAIINEKPETSTGLNDLFVVYEVSGLTMTYHANSQNVEWYKFSNLGGAYAEKLTDVKQSGNDYSVSGFEGNMGYYVEDNNRRYYYWIIDYSAHYPQFSSLEPSQQQGCDMTELSFAGKCDKITYYTINGQAKTLNRDVVLSYNTLEFDESSMSFNLTTAEKSFQYVSSSIYTNSPLTDTQFTLSADKYLRSWNEAMSITSGTFQTNAVSAETTAEQEERQSDNERKGETSSLGGSAPAIITFKAVTSDAVAFTEWLFSDDAEFENITLRMTEKEFTRTFNEQGVTYIRFVASNASGTCNYIGTTYEVNIGESVLECPNAFSPGTSEGVNDVWKVSYKSIIDFECHIFNRWGIEVCSFTDPSQGWDGRYRGKLVKSGVYFYVINAKGADGKEYKLKGDINIINYNSSASTPEQPDIDL